MCEKVDKKWFNYIIFDKVKTYVGSTVNLNRRIRQHNGEIKGGAKYTRNGSWEYYCVMYNLNNNKNKCLSEEWHIKWMTTKIKGSKNTYDRRKQSLEKYFPKKSKKYLYIFFLSKKFIQYLPLFNNSVFIIIIEDFNMEKIIEYIDICNMFLI